MNLLVNRSNSLRRQSMSGIYVETSVDGNIRSIRWPHHGSWSTTPRSGPRGGSRSGRFPETVGS